MTNGSTRKIVGIAFALAVLIAAGQMGGVLGPTSAANETIEGVRTDADLPVSDPASGAWERARAVEVTLSGQPLVAPTRPLPSVPSLSVRVLLNDTHAAFRLSWQDATKDNRTTKDAEFRDAVAILFGPADATPFICMGGPGKDLHVAQWKADWQADLDEGFRDLEHAYPNFWVDYYPYAIGGPPYHLPEAFPESARVYLPGWYVGNPFSDPLRVTPVEEGIAQGFGTLATQASQDALGRGVHEGAGWSVVISRRLDSGDAEDIPIQPGMILAFAVWDGATGDVGSRKSVSSWISFTVVTETPVLSLVLAGGLVLLIVMVVVVMLLGRRKRRREESGGMAESSTPAEENRIAPREKEPGG